MYNENRKAIIKLKELGDIKKTGNDISLIKKLYEFKECIDN